MNIKHPFNRAIIKLLIILMILQGLPLIELSRSYRWDIRNYQPLFQFLNYIITPCPLQAASLNDDQAFTENIIECAFNELISRQQLDGRWKGKNASYISDLQATFEVLFTLSLMNHCLSYDKGIEWYSKQKNYETYFRTKQLSQLILLLNKSNNIRMIQSMLAGLQNSDGGWGKKRYDKSNVYNTSIALQALFHSHYDREKSLQKGISFLLSSQNKDGSFHSFSEKSNATMINSLAIMAIQSYEKFRNQNTSKLKIVINDSSKWLANQQNINGGWGYNESSIIETGYAVNALIAAKCIFSYDEIIQFILKDYRFSQRNQSTSDIAIILRTLIKLDNLIQKDRSVPTKKESTSINVRLLSNDINVIELSNIGKNTDIIMSEQSITPTNLPPIANAGDYTLLNKSNLLGG